MVKPEISVRFLTQKGEWTSLLTKYENIRSPGELKEYVKSVWFEDHFDQLFKEFSDIKSYVIRNWPGYSGSGTVAIVQPSESQEQRASISAKFYSRQAPLAIPCPLVQAQIERHLTASVEKQTQERVLLEKQAPIMDEQQTCQASRASAQMRTPVVTEHRMVQERKASFQRERVEYVSSLERVIARTRQDAALCSPCSPDQAPLEGRPVVTAEQLSQQRAETRVPLTTEQKISQEKHSQERKVSREKTVLNEAETPITPNQQRRASFLREREEYASSLERIIAQKDRLKDDGV
jgi:hypothetical protein